MADELKNKIAEDFGLKLMDEAEQERMIEKIGTLLFESVIERSVGEMDEQVVAEFDTVVTEAGEDYNKILGFLNEKVPKFAEIVTEEMARLKRATAGMFA